MSIRVYEFCDFGDLIQARERIDGVVDGPLLAQAFREGSRWSVYRGDDLVRPASWVHTKPIAKQRVREYATEALSAAAVAADAAAEGATNG